MDDELETAVRALKLQVMLLLLLVLGPFVDWLARKVEGR